MSTASVLYKLRRILDDMGELFTATLAGDGQTVYFELPEDVIDPTTVSVTVQPANGGAITPLAASAYALDGYNGILVLQNPVAIGLMLSVNGLFYESWADPDLLDYMTTALAMHTQSRNPPVFFDAVPRAIPPTLVLPLIEERCVALLSARMVIQDQATAAAKDITIDTGDGTVIPRSQRYQQLVAEATRLDGEYTELVEKLGLQGYDTLQVETLRRTSMTTNRLVPIYVSREWDNPMYVQRVLPPIDTGIAGQGAVVSYRGEYNPLTSYALNDEVTEGSFYYLCVNTSGVVGVDPAGDVALGPDQVHGANWQITTINSGMAGYFGGW